MEFFEIVKELLYVGGLYAALPFQGAILGALSIPLIIMRIFEILGGLF